MLVFDQPQVSLSQVSYIDFAAAPVDICAEPSCRSVPQVSHAIVGEPAFWEINSSGETGFFFHWPIQLCQDLVSIRSDLKVVFIRGLLGFFIVRVFFTLWYKVAVAVTVADISHS